MSMLTSLQYEASENKALMSLILLKNVLKYYAKKEYKKA